MKRYFIKRNNYILRKYNFIGHAKNYFLKNKDRHSRSHFRIEDRIGKVLMSNRLLAA